MLTPVGVRALRGDRGADAVHPYPLDAQLLQLPLQVPLLSLKLVYLVNGFSVTIFKFLQVKGGAVGAHRPTSKWARTLHLAFEPRDRPALLGSPLVSLVSLLPGQDGGLLPLAMLRGTNLAWLPARSQVGIWGLSSAPLMPGKS